MMKKTLFIMSVLMMLQCSSSSDDYSPNKDSDTKEINKILQDEEVSWNKGDATTYSLHFDEEGVFTNILGQHFVGHNQFLVRHQEIFNGVFKGTVMDQDLVTFKFVDKDVVIVETLIKVSGFAGKDPLKGVYIDENGFLKTHLLQVLRKEKDQWKIVAYHNIDIKKGIPTP